MKHSTHAVLFWFSMVLIGGGLAAFIRNDRGGWAVFVGLILLSIARRGQ